MTPILTSVGIPLAGMAMLLAVDTIPDMSHPGERDRVLLAGVILSSGHLPVASDEDINSSGGSDINLVDPARGDWERSLAG
jgi:hypothetical protein